MAPITVTPTDDTPSTEAPKTEQTPADSTPATPALSPDSAPAGEPSSEPTTPPIPPPSSPSPAADASPDASASAATPSTSTSLPDGSPLPTIGRIVHYLFPGLPGGVTLNGGEIRPATVVRVWGGPSAMVNLLVMHDPSDNAPHTSWATSVRWSSEGEPNTWSWPPRV